MDDTLNQPRRFGKSTLVTNAFLAEAETGGAVVYEAKDYVCLSRKALENLKSQSYKAGERAGKKLTEEQFKKVMAGIESLSPKENEE